MISEKAQDLLSLARETLGADLLLPHFVNMINGMAQDITQLKTKVSALEIFGQLILDSLSMHEDDAYIQFAAVVKTLGRIIQLHSSHKGVVAPVVACLVALRDKNAGNMFKAVLDELSHTQFIILKQILQ